jgi:hypothetical protein
VLQQTGLFFQHYEASLLSIAGQYSNIMGKDPVKNFVIPE